MASSQDDDIEIMLGFQYPTNDTVFSFIISDEAANKILSALCKANGKKLRVKPKHHFHSQKIEGLEKKVMIKVLVGIEFENEDGTDGIHTFKNKREIKMRSEKLPANKRYISQFYFMNNNLLDFSSRNDVLDTGEKMKKAKAHLNELLVQ